MDPTAAAVQARASARVVSSQMASLAEGRREDRRGSEVAAWTDSSGAGWILSTLTLRGRGIGATVHYPPLHRMPLYATDGPQRRLTHTDEIADRILTLPIGASVAESDAERVLATLQQVIG